MKVGFRLHKYVWQWIVRNSDDNIQAKRNLTVIRHSDGGDLNRRGLSCWGSLREEKYCDHSVCCDLSGGR